MCCTCNISCAVPAIFQGGSKMCIRIVRLFQLLCGIQSIVMLQTAAPPLNYRATFKTTAPPLNYRACLSSRSAVFFSCASHKHLLYLLFIYFPISVPYIAFFCTFSYMWLVLNYGCFTSCAYGGVSCAHRGVDVASVRFSCCCNGYAFSC